MLGCSVQYRRVDPIIEDYRGLLISPGATTWPPFFVPLLEQWASTMSDRRFMRKWSGLFGEEQNFSAMTPSVIGDGVGFLTYNFASAILRSRGIQVAGLRGYQLQTTKTSNQLEEPGLSASSLCWTKN